MHIPKYWSRGEYHKVKCCGWSDLSESDAQAKAVQAAERHAARLAHGTPDREKSYFYGQGVLREEPIEEFTTAKNCLAAVITRNRAGCLVLNTAEICFIDLDLSDHASMGGFLKGLLGGKVKNAHESLISKVEQFFYKHPALSGRLYQTRAGMRVVISNRFLKPKSQETHSFFEELGADRLYVKLCQAQDSFRARLTPKPWRCGMDSAMNLSWPFTDQQARQKFEEWHGQYLQRTERYATCKLIKHLGTTPESSEIAAILEIHDSKSKANSGLDLA